MLLPSFQASNRMRGDDQQTSHPFSYLSLEQRKPVDHLLRPIRTITDQALRRLSPIFEAQLQYNLPFRWFVGLDMEDSVWTPNLQREL
jgi:hypothetical protein